MKTIQYISILIALGLIGFMAKSCTDSNAKGGSTTSVNDKIDGKVKEVMAKMDLTDKVGEMTQLSIDMLSVGSPYNLAEPHQLDDNKLKSALVDLRVGSILNCGGHAYTREHWHKIISKIQDIATKEKKSGIPVLYGIDAIHGANYTLDATLFPQQIGLAATWNPALAKQMGKVTAYETRASGIPWNFSPVLDMGRDARWPRFWETFGEDVHLATEMGEALMLGYQGDNVSDSERVAACLKHFLGYSVTLTGKDRTQAWVPERQLREYFLPTFKKAIDAGAKTIMINSGEINGIPVHANKAILTDLLRDELGFKGFAVTDWEDIKYLTTRHRVAKDYKEAIKMSINAGIDMSMVPMDLEFPVLLKQLVEEGEVPMSRIDEAVYRILRVKFELGLFDKAYYPLEQYTKFASAEHTEASFQAALESITLLKNDNNILPLAKNETVLVTGPTAHSLNFINGGWTHTWQGAEEKYNTKGKLTITEAIQAKIGKDKVQYVHGAEYDKVVDIPKAVAAAKKAKVAIVCLGEKTYTEKPGDIDDLDLPAAQRELVEAIAATKTPIILVLAEGRPRIISHFEDKTSAVLMSYLSGNEGGRAIAEILFGDYNPNGKLPFTYPRHSASLLTYDHKGTDLIKHDFSMNAFNPQYEFGAGLSYTTFAYSNLALSNATLSKNGELTISIDVKNTGERDGKEVIQLFISDKIASITPSVKRLRGFEKVMLKAGEQKTISFSINPRDIAFVGQNNTWITELGEFEVQMGGLKANFMYEEKQVN